MTIKFYETNIGNVGIEEKKGSICAICFNDEGEEKGSHDDEKDILKEAYIKIDKYLKGDIKKFTLPLVLEGTPFMKEVWEVLQEIPYGETLTYKEVAEKVGRPKAARAVGMACNKNPIPILIPCHRVIGSSGKLTGYRGGMGIKRKLLNLESKNL